MPFERTGGAGAGTRVPARRLHPLTLVFQTFDEIRAFAVPAVLGGAWMGGGHMASMATWLLALLLVPSVLAAIAEYLAFGFRVEGTDLVLDYGVLRRHHRVIPLSRVQSVELRQSTVQRLLGVAELKLDTAAGDAAEAALAVLGAAEATTLRAELLSRGAVAEPSGPDEKAHGLARLSAGDLVLNGATSNHAGVIAALLVGAAELAYQLGLLRWPGIDVRGWLFDRPGIEFLLPAMTAAAAVLLVAWTFSVMGALLVYHGFTLEHTGEELLKRYGAMVRRESSIPLERVQAVKVRESFLRRRFGLAALEIETAGPSRGRGGRRAAEAYLPLARTREIPRLVGAVFTGLDYSALQFRPVHPYARRRAFVLYVAALLGVSVSLAYFSSWEWLWLSSLVPLIWIAAHLHVRHRGYAVAQGYVALRSGFLDRTTWVIPERRVQTAHLRETIFQRRLGIGTLSVDTAAGEAQVVDLEVTEGRALLALVARAVRDTESTRVLSFGHDDMEGAPARAGR